MMFSNQIISVYVVRETVDEYGHTGEIIGVTVSKAEADNLAKGRGWYGGTADIREEKALVLDPANPEAVLLLQSTIEYPLGVNLPERRREKRKAALAKLSPEEKELLGVKEN